MKKLRQLCLIACSIFVVGFAVICGIPGVAQASPLSSDLPNYCTLPKPGSIVPNPPDIYVDQYNQSNPLEISAEIADRSSGRDCFITDDHKIAPTLRVNLGGQINMKLTNELDVPLPIHVTQDCPGEIASEINATSLHFHGLSVSPKCHQDQVIKTWILPDETFKYSVDIPKKEFTGLFWYHPHVHEHAEDQVLGGLTGAIIIDDVENNSSSPQVQQLIAQKHERVFVLRDLQTSNSNSPFSCQSPDDVKIPQFNCPPAKDISINSIPITYDYDKGQYSDPAVIQMGANQEFWRVANTAADTYFDLQVYSEKQKQNLKLELVALDGIPFSEADSSNPSTLSVDDIPLPPGGRAEFIIHVPSTVDDAVLKTLEYQTGPEGDYDPERTIAKIVLPTETQGAISTSSSELDVDSTKVTGNAVFEASQIKPPLPQPVQILYFWEDNANSIFKICRGSEDSNSCKTFDPNDPPAITVKEGTTEVWQVQNRTQEVHAFHIHQIDFQVLDSSDKNDPTIWDTDQNTIRNLTLLRDTINIPFWDGSVDKQGNPNYPSVLLKMNFIGKGDVSIAGTFVYHCHILEHEDKGMMKAITIKPL